MRHRTVRPPVRVLNFIPPIIRTSSIWVIRGILNAVFAALWNFTWAKQTKVVKTKITHSFCPPFACFFLCVILPLLHIAMEVEVQACKKCTEFKQSRRRFLAQRRTVRRIESPFCCSSRVTFPYFLCSANSAFFRPYLSMNINTSGERRTRRACRRARTKTTAAWINNCRVSLNKQKREYEEI